MEGDGDGDGARAVAALQPPVVLLAVLKWRPPPPLSHLHVEGDGDGEGDGARAVAALQPPVVLAVLKSRTPAERVNNFFESTVISF